MASRPSSTLKGCRTGTSTTLSGFGSKCDGEQVERSFWADGLDGERAIWENCLRALKAIGNAQIVSYGAYETRFLRQMRAALHFGARRRGIRRSAHRNVGQPRRLHLREGLFPDVFEQPQGSRPIPRVRVDLATGFGRRGATTAAGLGAWRGRRAQARTDRLQHGRLPSGREGRGRPGAYLRRRRVRPRCGRCRFAGGWFPANFRQIRQRPAGVRENQRCGVLGLSEVKSVCADRQGDSADRSEIPRQEQKRNGRKGSDGRRRPGNVPQVPCDKNLDVPRTVTSRLRPEVHAKGDQAVGRAVPLQACIDAANAVQK